MGVYRAAFTTMDQTQPLTATKVRVPVVALGGDHALGQRLIPIVGAFIPR